MSNRKDVSADCEGEKELTQKEGAKMREYYLELAGQNTCLGKSDSDEIDSADSTMATLILPGG